jgi:CYTH domain-containing protein
MHNEIERKFIILEMPNLKGVIPTLQERYFLQRGDLVEERIQKNTTHEGVRFEYEIKFAISPKERKRTRKFITESEFLQLRAKAGQSLLRESYSLSKKNPRISIKMYQGKYRGFVFAEVEFDSLKESASFSPLEWMGSEITDTKLGRDAWLLDCSRAEFLSIFEQEKESLEGEDSGD